MDSGCVMSTVHIMVALSVCDRLPIQPQLAAPPLAPAIHLALWGLTPGMYSGVNGIGLREKRVPDRECDQGYMQSRLEGQLGQHRRDTSLHVSARRSAVVGLPATTQKVRLRTHKYVETAARLGTQSTDAEIDKNRSAHTQMLATCTYRSTYDVDRCTPPSTDYIFQSVLYEAYLYVKTPQMLLETVTAAKHSCMR